MNEKTVTIEIDEQGNSSIDLVGFHGKGCADVAKVFQGKDVVAKSQTKREFHIESVSKQSKQTRS